MSLVNILKRRPVYIFMAAWMVCLGCIPNNASCMQVPSGLNTSTCGLSRNGDLEKIENFLAKAEVRHRLAKFGVKDDVLRSRLADLTDDQVHNLAMNINSVKSGGDGTVLVIVMVLLLVFFVFFFLTHDVKVEPKKEP